MLCRGMAKSHMCSAPSLIGPIVVASRGPGPRDATTINVMSLFVGVLNDFATALRRLLFPVRRRSGRWSGTGG